MRWILPVGCLLVLTVIISGCIQSPAPTPVTPVLTAGVVATLPETTVTPHPVMVVNITAVQTGTSVIIRVNGGNDAAALSAMNIRISNFDGTTVLRTIQPVETARPYTIEYYRNANADKVNIIGTFSDGYQQTLLMTSV
jgi:hypothetical protein